MSLNTNKMYTCLLTMFLGSLLPFSYFRLLRRNLLARTKYRLIPQVQSMAPKMQLIVGTASALGAGQLALNVRIVENQSSTPSPSQPEPQGASTTVPNAHEICRQVRCGELEACASKKNRTVRQIQSQINYIQRFYTLKTGLQGEWSLQAEHALRQWLMQELKGSKDNGSIPALQDIPASAHHCEDPAAAASSNPVPVAQDKTQGEPIHESDGELNDEENEDASHSSSSSSSSTIASSKRRRIQSAISNMQQVAEIFAEIDDCETCHGLIQAAIASLEAAL